MQEWNAKKQGNQWRPPDSPLSHILYDLTKKETAQLLSSDAINGGIPAKKGEDSKKKRQQKEKGSKKKKNTEDTVIEETEEERGKIASDKIILLFKSIYKVQREFDHGIKLILLLETLNKFQVQIGPSHYTIKR